MAFEVNLSPGYVSAFFFVVFDLILLTVADTALSIYVSRYYFHQILRHGRPLRVRSVDIPGLTSFLLGKNIISPAINLAAFLVKLFLLSSILLLDLNLETRYDPRVAPAVYLNTYGFDPSNEAWPIRPPFVRRVERQWLQVAACRSSPDTIHDRHNFSFYGLVYNLSNGGVLDNEVVQLPEGVKNASQQHFIPVDTVTTLCMNPKKVFIDRNAQSPDDVSKNNFLTRPLLEVIGCSDTFIQSNASSSNPSPPCRLQMNVSISIELPIWNKKYQRGTQRVPEGSDIITFSIFEFPSSIYAPYFPDSYHSDPDIIQSSLICTSTKYGPSLVTLKKRRTGCAFLVRRPNMTLFELWLYVNPSEGSRNLSEGSRMERHFRGPVFKGDINIGIFHMINMLQMFIRQIDWLQISTRLVAEATVYQALPVPVHVRYTLATGGRQVVSYVPWHAVGLILTVFLGACIALVIAVVRNWDSTLPQLNSINGLSSVAREERVPSGRSVRKGRPVHLGLSRRSTGKGAVDGQLHFGPLRNVNEAVRPIKDVDFV